MTGIKIPSFLHLWWLNSILLAMDSCLLWIGTKLKLKYNTRTSACVFGEYSIWLWGLGGVSSLLSEESNSSVSNPSSSSSMLFPSMMLETLSQVNKQAQTKFINLKMYWHRRHELFDKFHALGYNQNELLNVTDAKFKDEVQTCQVSRLCLKSHDFSTYITLSQVGHWFLVLSKSETPKHFWSCRVRFWVRYR